MSQGHHKNVEGFLREIAKSPSGINCISNYPEFLIDEFFIARNLSKYVCRNGSYYELTGDGYAYLEQLDRQAADSEKIDRSIELADAGNSLSKGMNKMTVAILIITCLSLGVSLAALVLQLVR